MYFLRSMILHPFSQLLFLLFPISIIYTHLALLANPLPSLVLHCLGIQSVIGSLVPPTSELFCRFMCCSDQQSAQQGWGVQHFSMNPIEWHWQSLLQYLSPLSESCSVCTHPVLLILFNRFVCIALGQRKRRRTKRKDRVWSKMVKGDGRESKGSYCVVSYFCYRFLI